MKNFFLPAVKLFRLTLVLLCCLTAGALLAQDPAKTAPMEGSTTDPAAHAKIGLKPPANPNLPTLFLVGDSTVRNGHADGAGGQWGWGEPLADLFDLSRINVDNRAIGGRSSRSYIMEGQWAETLAFMKPGDVVLFQWGHNDDGPLDDPARARGTIKGIGDESREVENPILKIHETVHTYGWYLRKYNSETKAKGATAIICSPIPRKTWKDGKVVRNTESYGGWARQIAEEQHVGFIDLNEIIARQYDALGEAAVEAMFADPHTHTSRVGAELNAAAVVSGLKALPNDPVAPYFSAKGKAVTPTSIR
jgi:rhamnogalacturonan acetylesterase